MRLSIGLANTVECTSSGAYQMIRRQRVIVNDAFEPDVLVSLLHVQIGSLEREQTRGLQN